MKKKILEIADEQNEWRVREQTVYDSETDGELFSVYDLTECPDADDYLRAVRYGIELAKAGYDEVEYISI